MSRIAIPSLDEAPAEARPVFDTVNERLGFVPNLHRLMSLSHPSSTAGRASWGN
jgi:hypothetical protein